MAEYISAGVTPTRRRTIIKDAQFPKGAVVAQYTGAREGLIKYLSDGARSPRHLAQAKVDLADKGEASKSSWTKTDCRNSTEAIEAFERGYNRLTLSKLDCRMASGKGRLLDQWPTLVSVAFDITIHKPTKVGSDKFGAALLIFSRGESSTKAREERCSNIAGLIYAFCSRSLGGFGEADPALCMAVDVFAGKEYRCPGTFARKLRHVEDSCADIAAIWHTVPVPPDYDGPPLRRPKS